MICSLSGALRGLRHSLSPLVQSLRRPAHTSAYHWLSGNGSGYGGQSRWQYTPDGTVFHSPGSRPSSQAVSDTHFDFSPYQCVGFDLDNTLCQYRVRPLMEMAYSQCLVPHLIERFEFPGDVFLDMDDGSELCARGIVLDAPRGNLLKLRHDGAVLRATHGSRPLTREEVIDAYGTHSAPSAARDLALSVTDPPCGRLRTFRDFFDAPAVLAAASLVDAVDAGRLPGADYATVCAAAQSGLRHMYDREKFAQDQDGFFSRLRADTTAIAHPCSPAVLELLRQLRRDGKLLFLVTSSHVDYARHMAELALGADWFQFFDVVVTYACKPRFFTGRAPFLSVDSYDREGAVVPAEALRPGRVYSQGSWADLYSFLQRETATEHPMCVYIGDNLAYDVHPTRVYTRSHALAVCEELEAEHGVRCASGQPTSLRHSTVWGSMLREGEHDTLWGAVVRRARACVPRLDYLASRPD
ncbi:5'-nucleotidase domain-containing protein 1 [Amphibalanus amphitrite]|uniref:5'-nucleotidase domain-containing protein 1 n=1 Tax=Amphibalanus amphitrite TaxID=1232801 RepID=A0A6A4VIC1_AMPAM|nr:5'-nucleotidase domain-containing protein 1 [Amphibalanus amphitrite]